MKEVGFTTYPDLETKQHVYMRYKHEGSPKWYVKCNELVTRSDGVVCRCSMQEQREDHYKNWLKTHVHTCQAGEALSQQTLLDYYNKGKQSNDPMLDLSNVYDEMTIFTGKFNLALDTFASPEFTHVAKIFIMFTIYQMMNKYKQLQSANINPEKLADKLYKPITRDEIRNRMIAIANSIHLAKVLEFAKKAYTCVAIDEGKTHDYHNLDFVLTNPLEQMKPYPVEAIDMKDGQTSQDYKSAITAGFNRIDIRKVKIGSVVVDGGPAQLKCFKDTWNDSFYHDRDPKYYKILLIPCLCHRIHNSYQYIAGKNNQLQSLVKDVHRIAELCRIHADDIGAQCPQHVSTRWIYDYNICVFILKYENKIKQYINVDHDKIVQLKDCLAVLKKLILVFESDKALLANCYIWLRKAISALNLLTSNLHNAFGSILASSLDSYTLDSDFGGLWCLAFSLTPRGRFYFHRKFVKNEEVEDLADPLSSFQSEHIPDKDPAEDLQDIYMDSIFEEGNTNAVIDVTDEGTFRRIVESDDQLRLTLQDVREDNHQTAENDLTAAKDYLKRILVQFRLNERQKTLVLSLYNTFINKESDIFENDLMDEAQNYAWEEISHRIGEKSILAEIALRLLCSSPSEATCERNIKAQRLILNVRRLRSKKNLLNSRHILMATK
ncbi:hypothetical protein TVAG_052210 [Trichomonas vaginalis G3]|uniref:Uncharacterized protein n=1 Tax=Trichomonas vaginalis (strain ATCC PRA-98 / G3) TaxID=412133 RepID=A2F4L7_TRIV3|nr:ribonuclease H-like family [Trichomonas vaginalis G3]XP_051108614.1 ribonuclease H-like family [Trichomonas vaginalis G3]EAY00173.1 hypothetical protein TVAG_052210 [Trichomonas vaginalis G3]KAI5545586.1 ribonuclease H-like family [Trichomonas vaginalis G3]KAI5547526.1 ribonuclease H-like family [Trichomonas vaginalis G3]|eukprot:XP_001313102.1 hypothetical protein [Trichomonas vaginalis G3]